MLKSLHLRNFTVFPDARLRFGKHLNVFVGENGSGKTHILKAAYSAIAASAQGRSQFQVALAEKLNGVFRPDGLGRLVRRTGERPKCMIFCQFDPSALNMAFSFSRDAKSEVNVKVLPERRIEKLPVFLPTRELLSISPGLVSLYETTHLPFEETWRDTCLLLGAPLAKGPRARRIKSLLLPLEEEMGGSVNVDSGRFYLNLASGRMEMHLVAEGLRKLATVARLIATGSLLDKGYLFWDEPEANLNPKIVKTIAITILQLAAKGIQVFIATHSLFLLRELHILQVREFGKLDSRFFGLHIADEGTVDVQQGKSMDDIGSIAALDEELQQSDRYIDTELGAA